VKSQIKVSGMLAAVIIVCIVGCIKNKETKDELELSVVDFGNVGQGSQVEKELVLTNQSREELSVESIISSCHCLTVSNSELTELKSSEARKVRLQLKLGDRSPGKQNLKLFVTYKDCDGKVHSLKGNVYANYVPSFWIVPNQLHVRVTDDSSSILRFRLYGHEGQEIECSKIVVNPPFFDIASDGSTERVSGREYRKYTGNLVKEKIDKGLHTCRVEFHIDSPAPQVLVTNVTIDR
jgi:hypothetical protein